MVKLIIFGLRVHAAADHFGGYAQASSIKHQESNLDPNITASGPGSVTSRAKVYGVGKSSHGIEKKAIS